MSLEMFPLLMQGVYTVGALPPILKLHRSKRSDQHALVSLFIALAAHFAMLAWATLYAGAPGLVASYLVSIAMTCVMAGTIVYYRLYPGGRPEIARAERRSVWHAPSERHHVRIMAV